MCDRNEVFMINFKYCFYRTEAFIVKYPFVSKTYVLPLTGTSTKRESDLNASGQPGSCIQPELLLLVCPGGEWAMLWLGGFLLVAVLLC